jgi:hypothetical protein
VTFIPGDSIHATGVTWHLGGVTFIPEGTIHNSGFTWHVNNVTLIPEGTKHNSGSTWHVAGETFIPPNARHMAGTTWHQNGATFLLTFQFNGDPLALVAECGLTQPCEPIECHQGQCNPLDQQCVYMPTPGAPCDDDNPYTDNDMCSPQGTCLGQPMAGAECDDANPCTIGDTVTPEGECKGEPAPAGEACASDNHCIAPGGSTCDGEGNCIGPIMVGAPCDDGDEGTVEDICHEDGACHGLGILECGDFNACNGEEGVDPLTGCTPGEPLLCNDLCAGESFICDPTFGCLVSAGLDCDQPNDCFDGSCTDDGCVIETSDCDDGNPCTQDICDGIGGCTHTPLPDGEVCDDGTACTIGESCMAGTCGGGQVVECGECQACNAETGECSVSTCTPDPCGVPFADGDKDGDVDQNDFGLWQRCFSGPGPEEWPDPIACGCFDRDGDTDVDQEDFGAFQICISGAAIAADPTCEQPPAD